MTIPDQRRYELSRFAYLRAVEGSLVLESGMRSGGMRLDATSVSITQALAEPRTLSELGRLLAPLAEQVIAAVLDRLETGGALVAGDEHPAWSFSDLLLHGQQRRWLSSPDESDTKQAVGLAASAALRQRYVAVDDRRCSVRSWGTPDREQLMPFLQQAAGGQALLPGVPTGVRVWAAVNRCRSLRQGLYRYLPADQDLEPVSGSTPGVGEMLDDAAASIGSPVRPPVLLCLTVPGAAAVSYTLLLRQIGALYHRMYLVATGLGLGPCAVGNGNSDLFAAESGADYYDEPLLGEFVLGAKGES